MKQPTQRRLLTMSKVGREDDDASQNQPDDASDCSMGDPRKAKKSDRQRRKRGRKTERERKIRSASLRHPRLPTRRFYESTTLMSYLLLHFPLPDRSMLPVEFSFLVLSRIVCLKFALSKSLSISPASVIWRRRAPGTPRCSQLR